MTCGGNGRTSIVATGNAVGPFSISAAKTTVPATVPIRSKTGDVKTASLLLPAIVKFTLLDPVENCVMGSLAGTSAFEVKVSLSCPDSGLGWGASSDIAIGNCCVAFAVAGTDGAENVDSGGSTAKLKVFANDVPRESVTVTSNVCDSTVVGVPCSKPEVVNVRAAGNSPFVTTQVKGAVPPIFFNC